VRFTILFNNTRVGVIGYRKYTSIFYNLFVVRPELAFDNAPLGSSLYVRNIDKTHVRDYHLLIAHMWK
jgi:hypothetical protein